MPGHISLSSFFLQEIVILGISCLRISGYFFSVILKVLLEALLGFLELCFNFKISENLSVQRLFSLLFALSFFVAHFDLDVIAGPFYRHYLL